MIFLLLLMFVAIPIVGIIGAIVSVLERWSK
jgi:hypothetical protein